ncbi:MAG: OmpA family protein [Salibacteraceae bacterium]
MKGIKNSIATLVALMIFSISYAQESTGKTAEADNQYKTEHFYEAVELYKKAYTAESKKSEKIRIISRLGDCYRLIYDFENAETWYIKAEKAKYGDVDPDLFLHMGQVYKAQGKFEEAIASFEKYNEVKPGVQEATDGLEGCRLAKKWMDKPSPHIIENVAGLNSKNYDYSPAIAGRGDKQAFIVSSRPGGTGDGVDSRSGEAFSDLFVSEMDRKGKWSIPSPVEEPINTEFNEGPASITKRDKFMYYTHCPVVAKETKPCELWMATKRGQLWAEPVQVKLVPDTSSIGHPSITKDDGILFFASDMAGGKGGKDIWYVQWDKSSKAWGEPKNVEGVNTAGDELFPFVRDDGTLFFSSNGRTGMGGLDIYKAEQTGKTEWSNVENLKFPINSAANDFGIFYLGSKEQGYFSSDRKGGKGGADIYSFKLPPVIYTLQGTIKDVQCKSAVAGATVKLIGTDGSSVEALTDAQGFYKFEEKENGDRFVVEGTSYTILVEKTVGAKKATPQCGQTDYNKRKYLAGKGQETTISVTKSTAFVHDFELQCSNCGEIKFKEVRYDLGKSELKVDAEVNSKDSLNDLYNTLIDNPTIVIELSAHTDARGGDAANQKLSEARAQSCVDYLISKGIDGERLVPKGYGEGQPLVDANGVTYNEAYINKLPTKAEKEKAHAANRRTVFSVLRDDFEPKPKEIEGENPEGAKEK